MPSPLSIAAAIAASGLPRLEARLLLQAILGVNHAQVVAHPERMLTAGDSARFDAIVRRRAGGQPIAYLLGEREFYSLPFRVTPAVLIPRPETELLVDIALEQVKPRAAARVLDLGTGSGCIAISIARHRPHAQVTAVDHSPAALAVAQQNAARLGVGNITFLLSDWYAELGTRRFHLIVSNPPYIADGDPHLRQGDLPHEPEQALAAGPDGLDAVRAIVAGGRKHLVRGGMLALEHGYDQTNDCTKLLATARFVDIASRSDLNGMARVALGICQD